MSWCRGWRRRGSPAGPSARRGGPRSRSRWAPDRDCDRDSERGDQNGDDPDCTHDGERSCVGRHRGRGTFTRCPALLPSTTSCCAAARSGERRSTSPCGPPRPPGSGVFRSTTTSTSRRGAAGGPTPISATCSTITTSRWPRSTGAWTGCPATPERRPPRSSCASAARSRPGRSPCSKCCGRPVGDTHPVRGRRRRVRDGV